MSKRTLPTLFLLSVIAIVAACHSKAPQSNPPPQQASAAQEQSVPSAPSKPAGFSAGSSSVAGSAAPAPAVDAPTVPVAGAPDQDAEIQKRFLSTITAAIAKADVGLRTPRTTFINNISDTVYAEYAGTYTYDIRKSESIVAPLVGTVSWDIRWFHNGAQAQEPMTLDARYGYQSGKWVIQKLVRKVNNEKFLSADEYLPLFQ